MKKITRKILLASLVFGLAGASFNFHLLKNKRFKQELVESIRVQEKLLSLVETMPKANASASEIATYVKMLYYMINGYPSQAAWNDLHGSDGSGPPVNGMLGMTKTIGQQMSAVIKEIWGYNSCAELAANHTGFTDDESGAPMSITIAAGTTAMPAAFPTNGGSANDLKLTIKKNSKTMLEFEFSCNQKAGIARYGFDDEGTNPRLIEMIFDIETAANSFVDFYMYFADDGEKFAQRFQTLANGKFSIYSVRTATDSKNTGKKEGIQVLAYGSKTAAQASAYIHFMNNQTSLTNTATTFKESGLSCAAGDCEALVCVPATGAVTLGSLCSGLVPSTDSIFASAPQSNIGTAADITMNWADGALSTQIFTP
ncbi:MAG: hypothetical protein HON90_06815 [Halobacteriovoraceae bacterium]|jgi:hypothetical protein|nr:hypothetical protein [Halobacteriovoraceae bacterium]